MLNPQAAELEGDEEDEEDDAETGEDREPWRAFPLGPPLPACSAWVGHGSHSNTQDNHRSIKDDAGVLARLGKPWEHLSLLTGQGVAMVPVVMYYGTWDRHFF